MSQSVTDSFRNVTRYLGQDYRFAPTYIRNRAPTPNDVKPKEQQGFYPINSFWSDSTNGDLWVLLGFYNSPVQARWVLLTLPTTAAILDIGVPNGTTPIAPDVNGLVNFTSTAGSITITGSAGGAGAQNINFDIASFTKQTFVPFLSLAVPGDSSFTYGFQLGEYTVLANLVCFTARILLTNFTNTTGSGNVQFGPLPFPSGATFNTVFACTLQNIVFDVAASWYQGLLPPSTTNIIFTGLITNSFQSILQATSLTNNSVIIVSGTYFTS